MSLCTKTIWCTILCGGGESYNCTSIMICAPVSVEELAMSSLSTLQGTITDILEENVVQPLLVSTSAIRLATETVRSILKIDDIVSRCAHLR